MRARLLVGGGLAVLLIGGCGGCPSNSPSTIALTVAPANAVIATKGQQMFTASGAPGPFSWTLPSGGGDIQADATGLSATVTAGTIPGTYRVRASSGRASGEVFFQVIAARAAAR